MPFSAPFKNPLTTLGDILVGAASGAISRLAVGANKTILASNGTTPGWTASPILSGTLTAEGGVKVGAGDTMGFNGDISVNVGAGATVTVATTSNQGLLILADSASGNNALVSVKGGGGLATFATDSAATWNVGSDAGSVWSVFQSSTNYVVKNRSGSARTFEWTRLGL